MILRDLFRRSRARRARFCFCFGCFLLFLYVMLYVCLYYIIMCVFNFFVLICECVLCCFETLINFCS